MAAHPANRYHLKDVHQEIDLYDRKISHCKTYETFATEGARADAVRKLETKRGTLVKAAAELVSKGVEFDPKDLPRSYKKEMSEGAVQEGHI
jgi:hypothetical protein